MARTVSLEKRCTEFTEVIDSLLSFYQDTEEVMVKDHPRSTLAEIVFHRGYVAFESFLSDWFIGCINRDATSYLKWLHASVKESTREKRGEWYAENLLVLRNRRLPKDVVAKLLDKDGNNVVFKDCSLMETRAREWLSNGPEDHILTGLKSRASILDAAKKIRNYIAHGSGLSLEKMNDTLKSLSDKGNSGLLRLDKNSIRKVGRYLAAKRKDDRTRLQIFFDEFSGFADDLKAT